MTFMTLLFSSQQLGNGNQVINDLLKAAVISQTQIKTKTTTVIFN